MQMMGFKNGPEYGLGDNPDSWFVLSDGNNPVENSTLYLWDLDKRAERHCHITVDPDR